MDFYELKLYRKPVCEPNISILILIFGVLIQYFHRLSEKKNIYIKIKRT